MALADAAIYWKQNAFVMNIAVHCCPWNRFIRKDLEVM
jgi:epoxyqueuosine reductase QueG